MLIMILIPIVKRINVRIIWIIRRLRYEYHMGISASPSFELGGCSYHNLDYHRRKGTFKTRIVLLGDHQRCLDQTVELFLERPANVCPLAKAIIIVKLICYKLAELTKDTESHDQARCCVNSYASYITLGKVRNSYRC